MSKKEFITNLSRTFLFTYLNGAVALTVAKVFCLFTNLINL